ncbi:MAG TPA: TIGR00730 family Rossman fold protein [Candidatus Dormibacteraeota bacterium]|nr:TIGR00730 family Rossman fold protein [Candidatus Dormibacteraeota bacterium]
MSENVPAGRFPKPAHPRARREPLPWSRPKPGEEDPDAPARLKAILESPSYRQADEDVDFLRRDETRGIRLEVDYLKPELMLRDQRIEQTIVVFGSTRIREPAAARRALDEARAALAREPASKELARRVARAERIVEKSRFYEIARDFGRLVGGVEGDGERSRMVVMTGGGPGIMEAVNRGAYDVGAKSIGLNITLPHEQYPNPYITPELCFRFHYFALRKLHFLMRAKALVAFPGGYGTFDELFEILTLVQTRKTTPVPVILVGESYWRKAVNIDFLVEEGTIDVEDRDLFWYAESADEIWNGILRWHEANGQPLVEET